MSPPKDQTGLADSDAEDEEQRQDLYELVREKRENPDRPPVSRLLYTGYLNEGIIQSQKIDIQQRIEDMLKELQDQGADSENAPAYNLGGFFLQRGLFCIHLLEGDSFVINLFMTKLLKDFRLEKSVWTVLKVICMNEENPDRIFTKHYVDEVTISGPTLASDLDLPDAIYQDRTWYAYQQMCQAGRRHEKKGVKERSQKKLQNEVVLSNDDMATLLMPYYMSIDDYAEMYLEDVEIKLDTEFEYPYKPALTRVLEYSDFGRLDDVKQ